MFYAVVVGHDDFVGPAVGVYCVLLYSMLRLIQVITTKLLVVLFQVFCASIGSDRRLINGYLVPGTWYRYQTQPSSEVTGS